MARYKIKSVANGKYVSRTDMRVQSYALMDALHLVLSILYPIKIERDGA